MIEQNDEWLVGRRYLSNHLLEAILDQKKDKDREETRTIERLLSASLTCRLRKQSLFAYLSDVLTASIRGDPIPTLA